MFKHVVTTESELRELIGSPSERAIKKDVAVLDAHCRDFIARSPFLLLATASARGRCDVSPKGDVDRKSTRLNSSHLVISYAVFCLKKKKKNIRTVYTKYDGSSSSH